jgi:hypothetical protein
LKDYLLYFQKQQEKNSKQKISRETQC